MMPNRINDVVTATFNTMPVEKAMSSSKGIKATAVILLMRKTRKI